MDKKKLAEHAAEDLLASHEAILLEKLRRWRFIRNYRTPRFSSLNKKTVSAENIVLICLNSKTALRRVQLPSISIDIRKSRPSSRKLPMTSRNYIM